MRILERVLIQMIRAIRVHKEDGPDGLMDTAGPGAEWIIELAHEEVIVQEVLCFDEDQRFWRLVSCIYLDL